MRTFPFENTPSRKKCKCNGGREELFSRRKSFEGLFNAPSWNVGDKQTFPFQEKHSRDKVDAWGEKCMFRQFAINIKLLQRQSECMGWEVSTWTIFLLRKNISMSFVGVPRWFAATFKFYNEKNRWKGTLRALR